MKPSERRKAREYAVQLLYSWQLSNNNIKDNIDYFFLEYDNKNVDIEYFYELILGVTNNYKHIDKLISPYLSRDLKKLGEIEKAILRISFYELLKRNDIPYRVSINEGIELAKSFGAEKSHKFINGVLDKAAIALRYTKNSF
ncbi:Transcription antitermination protein NusB [Buchnera aphidicola (Anoecia corni)]|uniref:Transcription antitermination protein NusB n=1 Tax=Buchnera aphidicola (Anoecia corni) TaxID=2994477 RepID=A0AAT9IH44_9GAMM